MTFIYHVFVTDQNHKTGNAIRSEASHCKPNVGLRPADIDLYFFSTESLWMYSTKPKVAFVQSRCAIFIQFAIFISSGGTDKVHGSLIKSARLDTPHGSKSFVAANPGIFHAPGFCVSIYKRQRSPRAFPLKPGAHTLIHVRSFCPVFSLLDWLLFSLYSLRPVLRITSLPSILQKGIFTVFDRHHFLIGGMLALQTSLYQNHHAVHF